MASPSPLSHCRFPRPTLNWWWGLIACVEGGPAGAPCVQDREERASPFREPEAWITVVREDTALLPGTSTDSARKALHEGDGSARMSFNLFDEQEDVVRGRDYSVRFERGDLLKQAAGTANPTVHVVWTVSLLATFPGLAEEDLDPDWISLRLTDGL